jgi:glycosyltransferase involved in cell wall biosynthesis
MYILLIAPQPFFQERGTPLAVRLLVEALCAQGHRVDLLTFPEGQDVRVEGLRILRIPRLPFVARVPIGISWKKLAYDALMCAFLVWLTLTRRYDVIHAVEESVFPAVLLRGAARIGVVYDMDSILSEQLTAKWRLLQPLSRAFAALERAAIRRTQAVFAVCKDLASCARAAAPKVPVFLIEDVAQPVYPLAGPSEQLRRELGLSGVLALYVGNLETYQGIEELIQALALVPPSTDLTLVLIGGAPGKVAAVCSLAKSLGVQQRCKALGPRPVGRVGDYLSQADILVSPRRQGYNTPMKVYSYMLSGKAILATRIPAHTQVLDDDSALLVAPRPQAIARGLMLLGRDPERRARLGAVARNRAANRYSLEVFREKVCVAYESLEPVEGHGPAKASDGR